MHAAVWTRRLPWSLVAATVALVLLGCLGIARSEELAGTSGWHLTRQLFWLPVCTVAMLLVTVPSYRVLSRYSYAAFGVSLVLLVAVYWFPPVNGASAGSVLDRWACSLRNLPSWPSCLPWHGT